MKQKANSPRQKRLESMAGPSYRVLFQAQKSRGDGVQAGSSKSLFRVGNESR